MSKIAEETSTSTTVAHQTANESFSKSLQNFLEIQATTKLIGDYLVDSELEARTKEDTYFLTACRSDLADRKCVREELLPHIFDANPKGVDAFFRTPGVVRHPKLLLTKASYREGYNSKKLGEFVCFREWGGVSPFQAAYLCGDGPFLGRKLLAYIIRDNTLSLIEKERLLVEARQQLQELLNRVVKAQAEEASATPAVAVATSTAATAAPMGKEFADSAEFLSPIKKLIKAYQAYTSHYDSLISREQDAEINKLWGEVGECHRRLPRYVLQEFFEPTPFDPMPAFNTEPPRGDCRYWNNELLDLDELGISNSLGLYRRFERLSWRRARGGGCGRGLAAQLELTAINRLCELREVDLRNTIDCLQSLESALKFINHNQTVRITP